MHLVYRLAMAGVTALAWGYRAGGPSHQRHQMGFGPTSRLTGVAQRTRQPVLPWANRLPP
jgi:hypothetical protein